MNEGSPKHRRNYLGEIEVISSSELDTQELGAALANVLSPGDVVALHGELGAGKTNLVKGIARGLGIRYPVHSPTFVLANEYRGGRMPLFHVDAYRISNGMEAIGIGIEDYLDDYGVTVIEWAERIREVLPQEAVRIELRVMDENTREIVVRPEGERYKRLLFELTLTPQLKRPSASRD